MVRSRIILSTSSCDRRIHYPGVLDTDSQVHWYTFHINKKSDTHVRLMNLSPEQQITLELFSNSLQSLGKKQYSGNPSIDFDRDLTAGTYYIKLSLIQFKVIQFSRITSR